LFDDKSSSNISRPVHADSHVHPPTTGIPVPVRRIDCALAMTSTGRHVDDVTQVTE